MCAILFVALAISLDGIAYFTNSAILFRGIGVADFPTRAEMLSADTQYKEAAEELQRQLRAELESECAYPLYQRSHKSVYWNQAIEAAQAAGWKISWNRALQQWRVNDD